MGITDPTYELRGHLDQPQDRETTFCRIEIAGWAIPPERIDLIEAIIDDKVVTRLKVGTETRPEVAIAYPSVPDAENGGFRASIPIGDVEGVHNLTVRAITYDNNSLVIGERSIVNSRSIIDQPPPLYHIGLITHCNLRCRMCPAHSDNSKFDSTGSTMDRFLLESSLDGLKEYSSSVTHICLCDYGEPLLYKEFFSVISRVHQICPDASIYFATNGTLLSKDMIENILDSSLTFIDISLDAGTKETYEKIRNGADFNKVLDNIRMLVKMRNMRKKKRPSIITSFVLMKSNINELPDFAKLCVELGVDQILTVNPLGLFEADNNETLYYLPGGRIDANKEKYERIIDDASSIALKAKIHVANPNLNPTEPRLNCSENGRTRPYIAASGDVYPCCVLAAFGSAKGTIAKPMGNIKKNRLKEIWESDSYRRFREAFFRGELPSPICARCLKYYNM